MTSDALIRRYCARKFIEAWPVLRAKKSRLARARVEHTAAAGRKRSPLTQVPAIENSSMTASTCTPIGYLARSVPTYGRKLEGRRTDDFPAVPVSHFVGFGAIGGPGRPRQLFLEKAAGSSRRIQEQHAPCFSAGVLPGVCDAAWQKRAGPRPADGDLISDLKGDFVAQYISHLVAVAVEMECRLGAGRRGFFEQHDAVAGIAA